VDFWELTFRFFSLADANVRYVVAGTMLLGGAAGGLGCFAYLQRRSLLGDAVAHAALPGVGLAFLLAGERDFMLLLLGAAVSGWLGALAVDFIVRYSKVKSDAALGIVLTFFFGLGMVILTHIQKSGSGAQSGLDKFLFGQASVMTPDDVTALVVISLLMLAVVAAGFARFKLLAFDTGFAAGMGIRVGLLQFVMTTLLVLAVTIGLQAVGVVLMAAMLITPAAAARQWTDRLSTMIILASAFGVISGVLGAYVSFLAPRLPTGPWMVVVVSALFGFSVLFSPRRGVISRIRRHYHHRGRMTRDHILKEFFKLGSRQGDPQRPIGSAEVGRMRAFSPGELKSGLARLRRSGLVRRVGDHFCLTADGARLGAQTLRRHRLWEVYLTRYLELPHDHVHRDAEDMEHIITPEMEKRLEEYLGRPEHDPHRQKIPYDIPGDDQ
jgi:manganese/zinc/iron transport system permease protein